ncbi:TPA: DUF1310 domain-containing protein [Listeria monocytogenes]|uniref:DUF1310 domain-containing protein n=6 Tax=Listeria monocytogenes TaxID=1639 RepID=A0A459KR66_LISMN|nr:DUF1310 domain-containing protein [Listeria monocytogenes]EAD5039708.1 DUF1310 family protein [Listeria monocytogenes serotype 1/2a]EAE6021235.1 DUF1310 family protein [Listeria monocytogenes serotype 3a]EAF4501151.1 DUF1310 family protein [Listeria monocytogenes serotype 4b]EAG6284274.1 DUF1310 family protein [Listeria monocytogenes CFSAN003810]EAG6290345.1 DUF1310 family protein [Listeria monocytogenes CFSAN003825]EAG6317599.1 DUF1310 family protein [Listeria monocytogenes CFSAN003824]E
MKKRWIIVLGMTVMTIFGLGVKFYMDEEKLNKEMKQVVYSDEAKQVFEKRLTNLDAKAFTKEGIIQSYEINKESIERNPMGGINVTLIINKDLEWNVTYTLGKHNGKLDSGGASISKDLTKKLELKGS